MADHITYVKRSRECISETQREQRYFKRGQICFWLFAGFIPGREGRCSSIWSICCMNRLHVSWSLSFQEWSRVFGNAKMITVRLDCLANYFDIIDIGNESYRYKNRGASTCLNKMLIRVSATCYKVPGAKCPGSHSPVSGSVRRIQASGR